jgi:acyl carrier protein
MSIEAILKAVVSPNELDVDATLIENGTRSMQVVYAMSKIENELGLEMQVSDFKYFLQAKVRDILKKYEK